MEVLDGLARSVDDSRVPYFKLAVGFLVAEYAFHTYLNLRQRWAVLTREAPKELTGHYSERHITRTRAYSIDAKNLALVKGVADFIESLALIYFMLLPLAWNWSRCALRMVNPSWSDNEFMVSAWFVMLITTFETAKSIPWGLYRVCILDKRHGFYTQSLAPFLADKLVSLILMLVLAPALLTGVVYILRVPGGYMPIYLWAFVFCTQMVFMATFPTIIAPMFNTYRPLGSGTLRTNIEDLARSLNFPLDNIRVVDGSKRSGQANAYMYGFGKARSIVLYDTLLKQCSELQVVAVLAHELGHWKHNHTFYLASIQQVIMLTQFLLFSFFRSSSHLLEEFGFGGDDLSDTPVIMSLTLFMVTIGPIDKVVNWLFNLLSRRFEFQADKFAVKMEFAEHLAEALKVLDKSNMSDVAVDKLYSQYHHGHPPIAERLRAIREESKKLT